MDDERLGELPLYREYRVKRGHRLLEYNGNLIPADIVHLLLGELCQILAVEKYFALGDISVSVEQAEYTHGGNALARAGFADYTDCFSRFKAVGNIVYRLYGAFSCFEICMKVLYFE